MRKLNIFLLIVFLLLAAFVAYFFIGGTLTGQVNTITAPAADHPEAFASVKDVIASGSAPMQFTGDVPASAEGCTLVDTTISLTNRGMFPAEWIDVKVNNLPGDVAVYSLTGLGSDVAPQGSTQLNLKILTTEPAVSPRTITLTYYVYGLMRSITIES